MTFPFQSSAFWGLLVLTEHHPSAPTIDVQPTEHRPRLIARWVRAADGRLERHWHRQPRLTH